MKMRAGGLENVENQVFLSKLDTSFDFLRSRFLDDRYIIQLYGTNYTNFASLSLFTFGDHLNCCFNNESIPEESQMVLSPIEACLRCGKLIAPRTGRKPPFNKNSNMAKGSFPLIN